MVATKRRHLIHMTSEGKLEVDIEVLPAEPRRSYGELFSSQLSVLDTIQALQEDTQKGFSLLDFTNEPVKLLPLHLADVFLNPTAAENQQLFDFQSTNIQFQSMNHYPTKLKKPSFDLNIYLCFDILVRHVC